MGNSHGSTSSNSSNFRNSMVAHHQAHQGYIAAHGSVLVNGGTSAAGSRQLQGGQSSSSAATAAGGSRASQSGGSSQVPVMNHQPQREDNFDVSF